jgi:serine phosphatase RsbU (regulator of sigma subunit)
VPISTPTTLLGTLWVFCNEKRDFNDCETSILELVAGRLASDLEREMLMRAGVDGAKLKKQVAAAERLQRNELPAIAPLLDGWDLAGWTAQAENVGGAFHDWFCLPDGLLAVAVGQAEEQGIAGALTANAVKTALRSHARYHRLAERILQQVNLTLWTGSAGDQHVTLFHGLIETSTGRVCCSCAGCPAVVLLRSDSSQSLSRSSIKLGESPEAGFEQFSYELRPGEALMIFAGGEGDVSADAVLVEALKGKLDLSAAELVAAAQAALDAQDADHDCYDRSILAIKRTRA